MVDTPDRFDHQWIALAVVSPFFLFPGIMPRLTFWVLAVYVVFLGYSAVRRRSLGFDTPLAPPMLLLALMATNGMRISPSADALSKFLGIILGVLVVRAALNACKTQFHEWVAAVIYLTVGAGFVAMGVLTSSVPVIKWQSTAEVVRDVPRLSLRLPGAEMGVNPNALGLTTLFFVPLVVAAAAALWSTPRNSVSARAMLPLRHPAAYAVARVSVLVALVIYGGVLLLTQSRSALVSAGAVTIAILLGGGYRRARFAGGVLMVAATLALGVLVARGVDVAGSVRDSLVMSVQHAESGRIIALETRPAIWSRALRGIEDAPWSGIGLSGFREAVRHPYPGYGVTSVISHAHNTFLQVALDVGLPGLVAYIALLLLASVMCVQTFQHGTALDRILATGIGGTFVAVHVFGIYDALALGAKVGLFQWWSLGMLAAMHRRLLLSRGAIGAPADEGAAVRHSA